MTRNRLINERGGEHDSNDLGPSLDATVTNYSPTPALRNTRHSSLTHCQNTHTLLVQYYVLMVSFQLDNKIRVYFPNTIHFYCTV